MAEDPAPDRATARTRVEEHPNGGWQAWIELSGSPFVYVLNLGRYEGGELVVRSVAIEPPEGSTEALAVTVPVVRELADRFERLVQHARDTVAVFGLNEEPPTAATRTRRELSPAFLREIASRHAALRNEGRPPTQTLAREERVSPGTVKHWLRKAKEMTA